MTNPTAARIARGYDEATEYDANHPGPFVVSGDKIYVRADRVVDMPRKYGMAERVPYSVSGGNVELDDTRLDGSITAAKVSDCANDNHQPTLDDLIGKAVYIASPYTKYAHGHAAAAYDAAEVAARLIDYGLSPLSPIAHSHAVATVGRLDKVDGELWQRVDAPWVRVAEACVVVKMPGWEESAGVQHEIAEFRAAGKPVVFMDWGMG